ncbi:2-oxoadipate dioxygenase/decarboxylase family protein [Sphingomonas nostoxanthinifaciens]|uniref:2-oxoadipate dioxygenase/decarboxylase family protein n=1 Tax=Sphingomonas nostoxanthinifaciens TaxID=2872652 RepID=UPI001CC202BF|nr:DUF1338 family protein [Sphingomonas nostoxanthinifaciens]UAK26407.1 DUF1338 family protein [Sphingomonas nostoxanthinifaciens]
MENMVARLVRAHLGDRADGVLAQVSVDPAADTPGEAMATRSAVAMALTLCLFDDLLARVPTAATYVAGRQAAGERICFDHGAIRTIRFAAGPTGALPAGEAAFTRLLAPLGYEMAAVYPLPALRMTGRAWRHRDHPETIPQFFVSELHVDQFDDDFADVAQRIFGASRDPLDEAAHAFLRAIEQGPAPFDMAAAALPALVAAFGRQHPLPTVADYEALRAQSAEAAWIATEGNAFNHATDRVADVDAVAAELRALGQPMKERVEVSASGRVRQTAFRADTVVRTLGGGVGPTECAVPGSFYEFITRAVDPATGRLDLGFDSGNATGIFAMTRGA